jgi:hypothetical protein
MEVVTETVGLDKAITDLDKLGLRGSDVRGCAPEVRAIYLDSNRKHLNAGSGWPALSEQTVERKSREGLPPIPEIASGALYRSLTSETRIKGQKNRVQKSAFVFGSTLFYAAWQQGTKHQPERKLIDLSFEDRLAMAKVISRYVAHGAEGLLGA